MEYICLGAIIGLCFFNFFAYRRGIKDGLALREGKPIEPIQPLQTVQRHIDKRSEQKVSKDAESLLNEGMINIMAYDGMPQKPRVGEK